MTPNDKEKLTEEFQEEFAVAVTRTPECQLIDFGLHEDLADLTYIAEWWLNKFDILLAEKVKEARDEVVDEITEAMATDIESYYGTDEQQEGYSKAMQDIGLILSRYQKPLRELTDEEVEHVWNRDKKVLDKMDIPKEDIRKYYKA